MITIESVENCMRKNNVDKTICYENGGYKFYLFFGNFDNIKKMDEEEFFNFIEYKFNELSVAIDRISYDSIKQKILENLFR